MRRNDDQCSALQGVTCEMYRESLSAQMDGETAPLETAVHLAGCGDCAEWARIVPGLQRPLRMSAADDVPDLAERILNAIIGDTPRPSLWASLARSALMAAGIVQVVLGVVHLITHDGSAQHTAAELAAWSVAIGIGFGTAALRPHLAYAVLPMLAAVVAILGYASVRDLLTAQVPLQRVLEHALIGLGLLLLAGLAWTTRRHRRRTLAAESLPGAAVPGSIRAVVPR